jgi:ubiquinone/menaquinone biosynthesis C-methylase UbiE
MFNKSFSSEEVRKYYNDWDERYERSYGNIIQAFRPANDDLLIDYLLESLDLRSGKHYLDAGCGVGGVSVPFAQKIDCKITGVTISDIQAEKANKFIQEKGLDSKIKIFKGDFHHLSNLFEHHIFDGIFFMESLGHSNSPEKVLSEAYRVLKPGGFIYIKDFYIREGNSRQEQKKINKVIEEINKHYKYQVMNLNLLLSSIRKMDVKLNFLKSFDFQDDISVRYDFETKNNIELFEGQPEFMPADWYEIKFTKY